MCLLFSRKSTYMRTDMAKCEGRYKSIKIIKLIIIYPTLPDADDTTQHSPNEWLTYLYKNLTMKKKF